MTSHDVPLQFQLGSLVITADPTLQREGFRLITVGQRVVKCLKELVLGMLTCVETISEILPLFRPILFRDCHLLNQIFFKQE